MIGYIEGIVVSVQEREILVNAGGVGYEVWVGPTTINRLRPEPGKRVALFTDMIVKEDSIQVFGFENAPVKYLFRLLMSVNGVGAKMALAAIDHLGSSAIIDAIQQNNSTVFERVSGIGKKGAQKIVIELENKLGKYLKTHRIIPDANDDNHPTMPDNTMADLISALVNMGYSLNSVEKTVKNMWTDDSDFETMFKRITKKLSDI